MKYKIKTIENYPDDGKHLECFIPLPFQIRKGEDGYYWKDNKGNEHAYNIFEDENRVDDRWIVHLRPEELNPSLIKIFEIKVNKNLDEILKYCIDVYRKSLKMEMKRIDKLLNE